jgi:hypothetical protein
VVSAALIYHTRCYTSEILINDDAASNWLLRTSHAHHLRTNARRPSRSRSNFTYISFADFSMSSTRSCSKESSGQPSKPWNSGATLDDFHTARSPLTDTMMHKIRNADACGHLIISLCFFSSHRCISAWPRVKEIHSPQRVVQPGTRATASLRACGVRCAKLARRDLLTAGRIAFDWSSFGRFDQRF